MNSSVLAFGSRSVTFVTCAVLSCKGLQCWNKCKWEILLHNKTLIRVYNLMDTLPFFVILNLLRFTNGERVVTDLEQIPEGVHIDYSYNETRESTEGFISVAGCPKSLNGYPWVIFGETEPRCYLVGESGPCDPHTKLHMMKDSQVGLCKFPSEDCEPERGDRPPRPEHPRYTFCIPKGAKCHELFYDNVENRAYPLYTSQGPCESPKNWPEPDDAGGVRCAPRQCPEGLNLITKESDKEGQVEDESLPCCIRRMPISGQTGVSHFEVAECPDGQRYSEVMQRCYVPVEDTEFVIG